MSLNTILDEQKTCQCIDCMKDYPLLKPLLEKFCTADPTEKRELLRHLYHAKPFVKDSWTKDWKSITHRDYSFRPYVWSSHFPERVPIEEFREFVCKKWCKEPHNPYLPPDAYSTPPMPNLFEEPWRAIYSEPRKCEGAHIQDYTWKNDYRPHGPFPGWCLKGEPPDFANCDRG
ncbi:uncharacterized protein [Parasteatoda tepidariorum]|uniref:uncharacterized protein n=1 Tax=Parasteatoda tepidariorum TaxID=114398 RepID=UPI00077F91C8